MGRQFGRRGPGAPPFARPCRRFATSAVLGGALLGEGLFRTRRESRPKLGALLAPGVCTGSKGAGAARADFICLPVSRAGGGPPVPPCRPSLALGFLHFPWLGFALRWGQPSVHLGRGRWHWSPRRSVAYAGGAREQSCRRAGSRAGVGGGCPRRGPGGSHVSVGHPEQHGKGHPGPHCALSPSGTSHKLRPEPRRLQRGREGEPRRREGTGCKRDPKVSAAHKHN